MRKFALIVVILCFAVSSWGFHEFKVPKKAYKKVTIEHFSNPDQKTSPDSTVTIYYDKDGMEIWREVKPGCGNMIGGIDSLELFRSETITFDPIDTLLLYEFEADWAIDSFDFDTMGVGF